MPQALGMLVALNAGEILKKLEQLKTMPESEWPISGPVLMRALAERCGTPRSLVDGLTAPELQTRCYARLYLSRQNRFAALQELLYGADIFHDHRLFVPRVIKLDQLWKALKIREP